MTLLPPADGSPPGYSPSGYPWSPNFSPVDESADGGSAGRLAAWGVPVGVVLLVAALGVPVGLLWSAVAPRTTWLKIDTGAPVYADPNSEAMVAADGWFLVLGLGVGVLIAVAAWRLLRRYRGVTIMAALVLGSLVSAWLAWQTGHRIGLAAYLEWRQNGSIGSQRGSPLSVRVTDMKVDRLWPPFVDGVLAAQALAAAFVYTCCAGWSRFPSLRGPDPFNYDYPAGYQPMAGYDPAGYPPPTGYGPAGYPQQPGYGPAYPQQPGDGPEAHPPQPGYGPEAHPPQPGYGPAGYQPPAGPGPEPQFGPGRTDSSESGTGTARS